MMYGYYGGYDHWFGLSIIGLVLIVIFWALVIVLVARFIRWISGGSSDRHDRKARRWHKWQEVSGGASAIEVLNERYAKGEINKEEYEQKKKDILSW